MIRALTNELCRLLHLALPAFAIYDDGIVPQEFTRPALCIVPGECTHTQLNTNIIRNKITITIYVFPELDESGAAAASTLQEAVGTISSLFFLGYVRANSRAIKVDGDIRSDCSMQDGYVECTLYYNDSISSIQEAETIQNINIRRE